MDEAGFGHSRRRAEPPAATRRELEGADVSAAGIGLEGGIRLLSATSSHTSL